MNIKKSTFAQISLLIAIISLPFCLASCVPAVGVTAAAVGVGMAEDRSAGVIVDDTLIVARIKAEFANSSWKSLLSRISVDVTEGKVLLTGSLKSQEDVTNAIRLAWKAKGVKEVMSELEIEEKSLKTRAHDKWLSAHIRTKLLVTARIQSMNYTVDVNNGVAYIMGIAHSDSEERAVIEATRTVNGVRKVVNYITIRND